MKIGWTSTLDGYCTRRQRLALATELLAQKAKHHEIRLDRLEIDSEILDNMPHDRRAQLSHIEKIENVGYNSNLNIFQGFELALRMKITNLRYFLKEEPLEARIAKKELIERDHLMDKQLFQFKRRTIDLRNSIALAETSEKDFHVGKYRQKGKKVDSENKDFDDAHLIRMALEDVRKRMRKDEV